MTKCREGIPSVQLDRNPRILEYDSAGTDDGVRIVTLVQGFAFEDAAARTEDDPDGRQALHSRGFENVHTALWAVRDAAPCRCGRCVGPAHLA